MPDHSSKWRIDTLDARGGLAFASWRPADLVEEASLPDRPVFHFSPPAFTPSPVASAATAIAAERHGFQLGVYDETGEVPFDTLADVAEFVRRIYVATGRSDGTDGGSDPPPVPPPEPEPMIPAEGLAFKQAEVSWLRRATSEFQLAVADTLRGSSKPVTWGEFEQTDLKKASAEASLVLLGAELTLFEMLRRFPRKQEERETWQQAAMRLASTLLRTGAAQLLIDDETRPIHKTCLAFLPNLRPCNLHQKYPPHPDFERFPLYWTIEAMMAPNVLSWPPAWLRLTLPLPTVALAEPLDDLAHFPASSAHATAAAAPDVGIASVADVLSSVLASPTRIAKSSTLDAIVAFAAARIVAFDGARWTSAQLKLDGDRSRSRDLDRARFERLTLEAYKWLSGELPTRAFSSSVERLIERGLSVLTEESANASSGTGGTSTSTA